MVTRDANGGRSNIRFWTRFLLILVLWLMAAGCGAASQTTSSPQQSPVSTQLSPTPTTSTTNAQPPLAPTTIQSVLKGPTNFILKTPFNFIQVSGSATDQNGTPTALPNDTVEAGITQEFQHLLFVVDSSNQVEVYSPGSTSPTKTQVTQRTDGSVDIDYTQTLRSNLGVAQIAFDGVVFDDQIYAQYQQAYSPAINSSGTDSSVAVSFSTHVQWVPTNQIPTAPENARFQFTSNSGIALAWDGGKNAVAYDVYRLIPNEDQQFQLIATVKTPTYIDMSPDAWQNAHSSNGITYGIFSVGSAGVENPSGLPIPVATA